MEKSKAESRINGGTMRPVSRGQFQKEIEEVIFSLKRGEVSKPVKGDRGYYIFLLVDRREKSPEEMEKLQNTVREKIQQLEITKRGQEALEKKAEELRKKEKVEVFYDRIQ
jgi:parvulin-like peptidyl-prolyl isomerase